MTGSTSHGASGTPVRIVSAANESYAVGLAALMSSVLTTAESPGDVQFLVLDCGLATGSRRRLRRLATGFGAELQVFPIDLSVFGSVDTTGHGGAAAYARLISPWILREHHGKVVYLDSDVIVRRDLRALLDHEIDDETWAWAVPEVGVPFVSSPTGVFDWREQGMDPTGRYFNSGVLVFDLDVWRRQSVPERTLHYLRTHGVKVFWWDQGGLNVTLNGHWQALDLRWNQTYCVMDPETTWTNAGFDRQTLEAVKAEPFIVHFNGSVKPWQRACSDPRVSQFFACLAGTPWTGFQPRTPFWLTRSGRLLRKGYRLLVSRRPPAGSS